MDLKTIMKMKRRLIGLTILPILAIAISACDNYDNYDGHVGPRQDLTPPPVPTGVTTVTMDQKVLVEWNAVVMDPSYDDLAGYKVYRCLDDEHFGLIATVESNITSYLDEGLDNGTTYYYAVSSFDFDGNLSDLSTDNAFDTPRPEGSVTLYSSDDVNYDDLSGFDFSREIRLRWDDPQTNFYIYFDNSPGVGEFFIYVPSGSRIQDMGYTQDFDEITYAPDNGWSSQGYFEVINGHTYVIKTSDNHYAKVRAVGFSPTPSNNVLFDWGYQVDPGNRELKIAPISGKISTQVNVGTF